MAVPSSIKQTLENASQGMIRSCKAKNNYVQVDYYNGFNETIWFKSLASATIFANTIKAIKDCLKLELGETYVEVEK